MTSFFILETIFMIPTNFTNFTTIFITRILLDWSINKGDKLTFVTGFSKNFFTNFHFDFLGIKKWTYLFSGLERGLDGMKAGGERVITIPSKLGYGSKGSGAEIPPDSDLIFEVKVIKVG